MNHPEAGKLLAVIVAYDRRTIGETDVLAWQAALTDIDYQDAHQAVIEHYRHSREWLMPADIHEPAARAARRRAGQQRLAQLEQQRIADEQAEQLAIAATPPVDREQLANQLKALALRGRNAVPREDPRPPDVRLDEARRQVAAVAARTSVGVNVHPSNNQEGTDD